MPRGEPSATTANDSINNSSTRRKVALKKARLQEEKKEMFYEIKSNFVNARGRKKKYTPQKLKNRIIDYFAEIMVLNKPPTVSGLMVHLKMNRDQFYQYAQYPEYRDIMEHAKNIMENWLEERLVLSKTNPSGLIFALKNRFNWKDTQTIEHEGQDLTEAELIHRIAALAPDMIQHILKTPPQIQNKVDERAAATVDAEILELGDGYGSIQKVVPLRGI